jgi:pimeloyl-ACP methyl ester carboxylesterase
MQNARRQFLQLATVGAVGVSLAGCASLQSSSAKAKPTIVLVHGAFLGGWAFQPAIAELSGLGYSAVALDLPGHGLNARFPASYFVRPLDNAAFGTELSPRASTSLESNVVAVLRVIDNLEKNGSGPVVLVGHSMGGIIITAVAERAPEKIAKLVYVSALLPKPGVPAIAYIQSPQNAGDKVGPLLKADPKNVAALRIDPNSPDAAYNRNLKDAFFNDVNDEQWPAVQNLLISDAPVQPFVTPLAYTAEKWGRIPRAFIRCGLDNAVRPALQDRMIGEADALTPGKKTQVVSLNTGHSPFISRPVLFAEALAQIVG